MVDHEIHPFSRLHHDQSPHMVSTSIHFVFQCSANKMPDTAFRNSDVGAACQTGDHLRQDPRIPTSATIDHPIPTRFRLSIHTVPCVRGFTLIELLISISIMAILAGLLIPAVKTVTESAKSTKCQNAQKMVTMGCIAYANDNDSQLPSSKQLRLAPGDTTQFVLWSDLIKTYLETINIGAGNQYKQVSGVLQGCPKFVAAETATVNGGANGIGSAYAYSFAPNSMLFYDGTASATSMTSNYNGSSAFGVFTLGNIPKPSERIYFHDVPAYFMSGGTQYVPWFFAPSNGGWQSNYMDGRHSGKSTSTLDGSQTNQDKLVAAFVDGHVANLSKAQAKSAGSP